MQAVCYLRPTPTLSLEDQQRAFLAECERERLEVGPTFTETAAGPGAPEFRRMLRTLLGSPTGGQRGFVAIFIAALEVLGATAREQARRYLQLEALQLPLRIAGGVDPDAALLSAWSARSNLERRREQVRAGMRDRALRGEVLGRAPYGYRVVARHLRVEPPEAAVVHEIFRRYLDEDEGLRVIAGRLNEAGTRTRRGGPWSIASIREVLRNPVYVGTYRRLGVVVPSEHEPLITRERFAEAQQCLAARRTSFARQQRGEYLLAGLARCGYCGSNLIGVRRSSRARLKANVTPSVLTYYQCEARANRGQCDYHTRRAEALEAAVRNGLRTMPSAPTQLREDTPLYSTAASHREGLRRRLDTLLERRVRGEWDAARLREEAARLALEDLQAEERADFEDQRRGMADKQSDRQAALAETRLHLVEHWDALPFDERRRLLRQVVSSIVVADDDVRVTLAG